MRLLLIVGVVTVLLTLVYTALGYGAHPLVPVGWTSGGVCIAIAVTAITTRWGG